MNCDVVRLKNKENGLPLSNKMGRYLFVSCFPGSYNMGMANLGYQSVIKVVYDIPNWRVERLFSDTGDQTFEKKRRLIDAHIVGFTVGFEHEIFPLIVILQQNGIPMYAQERSEYQPLVLVGGPLATLNPELLAPFADIIFIGECEETLPRLLMAWEEGRLNGLNRQEILQYLCRFPGTYIPQFYYPKESHSKFIGFEKEDAAPKTIHRQWVDIEKFETRTHIYTPESFFKNMGLLEMNRGCGFRCRFCAGGVLYRPLRQRSIDSIIATIDRLRLFTPHIGIIGADILSHPEWEDIIQYMIKHSLTVNFSSLSAVTLAHHFRYLGYLVRCGVKTVTLAPESGDQDTRKYLGKALDDESWIELIHHLLRLGIPKVKLYFMLGKPFHSAEKDLDFLDKLSQRINLKNRIMVSYSFLVPKPQTNLERMTASPFLEWKKDKTIFESGLRKLQIRFSGESLRVAWIELLLSRSDRRVAEAIPTVLNNGGMFNFSQWRLILRKLGRDLDEWPRQPWEGQGLPWSIIDNVF